MLCGIHVLVHTHLYCRQLHIGCFYYFINDRHSSLSLQGESQVRSEEGKWLTLF